MGVATPSAVITSRETKQAGFRGRQLFISRRGEYPSAALLISPFPYFCIGKYYKRFNTLFRYFRLPP